MMSSPAGIFPLILIFLPARQSGGILPLPLWGGGKTGIDKRHQ
jgi:hypothetical protein